MIGQIFDVQLVQALYYATRPDLEACRSLFREGGGIMSVKSIDQWCIICACLNPWELKSKQKHHSLKSHTHTFLISFVHPMNKRRAIVLHVRRIFRYAWRLNVCKQWKARSAWWMIWPNHWSIAAYFRLIQPVAVKRGVAGSMTKRGKRAGDNWMHAKMCIEAELQFIFAEIPGTQMHAIPSIIPFFYLSKAKHKSTRQRVMKVLKCWFGLFFGMCKAPVCKARGKGETRIIC